MQNQNIIQVNMPDHPSCPRCGSEDTRRNGGERWYAGYSCNTCYYHPMDKPYKFYITFVAQTVHLQGAAAGRHCVAQWWKYGRSESTAIPRFVMDKAFT